MKKLKMIALLLLSSCTTPQDIKEEDEKCEEFCKDVQHYYIAYTKQCLCFDEDHRDI